MCPTRSASAGRSRSGRSLSTISTATCRFSSATVSCLPDGAGGFFGYDLTDEVDERKIVAGRAPHPPGGGLERPDRQPDAPHASARPRQKPSSSPARRCATSRARCSPDGSRRAPGFARSRITIRPVPPGSSPSAASSSRRCSDVGAGLLLGSDAPQVFNVPGFSLHRELALSRPGRAHALSGARHRHPRGRPFPRHPRRFRDGRAGAAGRPHPPRSRSARRTSPISGGAPGS